MITEVDFEEIGFAGESEYLRFRKWIFDFVDRGLVEKVDAQSTNFLERNFFRRKGDSQIWTLADPIDPLYVSAFGYFAKLKITPVDFTEQVFQTQSEYDAFVKWLDDKIEKESVFESWQSDGDIPQIRESDVGKFRLFYARGKADTWILSEPQNSALGRFWNFDSELRKKYGLAPLGSNGDDDE